MSRNTQNINSRAPRIDAQVRRLWVILLALAFCSLDALGADTNQVQLTGGSEKSKGKNKPVIGDRPQVIGSSSTTSDSTKPGKPGVVADTETTRLVSQFQTARAQYLETQKEVALKMKDGTEEQRAVLREQAKEALDKWREEHRAFVEEQKERAKQMKQELHPDLGPVVDRAGEGGGGGRDR